MNNILTNHDYQSYTYQHIQGCMLIALNQMSLELGLSHAEYKLMGFLIGLYNKKYEKAFPSIEYLRKLCRMAKKTVINLLDSLVEKGLLIIVKTPGKRNSYHFTNLILKNRTASGSISKTAGSSVCKTACGSTVKPQRGSACKTTHDINIQNREQIEKTYHHHNNNNNNNNKKPIKPIKPIETSKNDDVSLKTQSISEYKQVINKLNTWRVLGAKNIIKKYGVEKIKKLIEIVETKNPNNPGAYFRSLLTLLDKNIPIDNKIDPQASEKPLIYHMVKYKFWRHKSTGQIVQALPDVGNHLLIQYWEEDESVTFIELNKTDYLKNFEVIENSKK